MGGSDLRGCGRSERAETSVAPLIYKVNSTQMLSNNATPFLCPIVENKIKIKIKMVLSVTSTPASRLIPQ